MHETTLRIGGMHCEGCAGRIRTVLQREPGVRAAEVSYAQGQARVRHVPQRVDAARLAELVEQAGFRVTGRDAP